VLKQVVVMIGNENVDDSVSVIAYSQKQMPIQIQAKPTTWLLLRTVIKESEAQK
jgi:hypothetical protein